MISYTVAGPWADHVRAFSMIESGENELAIGGDGGKAFGLLQQHASFLVQWYRNVDNTDTLTQSQIKACASFLAHYVDAMGLDAAVQIYNKGIGAYLGGIRAPDYLARWTEAYQKVRASG